MAEKRILVVYYSRTGVTETVAKNLAERLGAEIEAIAEERDRNGAVQYMLAGKEALMESLPPINPPTEDPANFDLVVLGTPVWAFKMASPMRSYLAMNEGKFREVALFCTHRGSGGKGTFESFEKVLDIQPVAVVDFHEKSVRSGEFSGNIDEFLERLAE
ncbi:MAG TPA: hypothetical protein ENN07_02260 [candidate division Zixibacteria bacterium]|nr:hypothetical protein [candidate division Zixibacteria bacterium]